ncbi:RAM signaling network component [Ascosphaera pollenicola]|nr:RAM signaling network component [Ascosphaera pollenicola]
MRSETTIQHVQKPSPARSRSRHPPVPILPSSTLTPALNDGSRSSSRSHVVVNTSGPSSLLNTPRSGESFSQAPASQATSPLPVNPLTGLDDSEEERSFEKIFVQLTAAYNTTLSAVPMIHRLFAHQLSMAEEARAPPELRALWNKLIFRCRQCVEVAEQLKERLTNTRIREPAGDLRNQKEFWQLCKSFLHAFIELVSDMREAKNMRLFSPDVAAILRPVQRASREVGRLIESSPWSYMAELNASTASTPNHSVSQADGSVRPPHPAVLTAAAPRQHAGSASNAHSPSNMPSNNATPLSKIASRPPTPLSSGFGVVPPSSRPPIPTPPQTTAHFFDRDRPLPPDPPTQRTDGQQPVVPPSIATFSLMRR